jgi:hypothetical protein|tara:strand:+ start:402 stop:563 length:162 start_codon:yes stop_codon:yes gene_type:complete
MDQGKAEIARLKSFKADRSFKEAKGYDFKAEDKSNKLPWAILIFCFLILFFIY